MIKSKKYNKTYSYKLVEELMESGMELLMPYVDKMKSDDVRNFTMDALAMAPPYFWVIPSNKHKFHPKWTRGDGGLVKHTEFALYLAEELCDTYSLLNIEKDIVLSAVILHDTLKNGMAIDDHYGVFHPFLPRAYYKKLSKKYNEAYYDDIMCAIESHMGDIATGKWTPIGRIHPRMDVDKVVHLADYIASRPRLGFK